MGLRTLFKEWNKALEQEVEITQRELFRLGNKKQQIRENLMDEREYGHQQWRAMEHEWHAGKEEKMTELARLDAQIGEKRKLLSAMDEVQKVATDIRNDRIGSLEKIVGLLIEKLPDVKVEMPTINVTK